MRKLILLSMVVCVVQSVCMAQADSTQTPTLVGKPETESTSTDSLRPTDRHPGRASLMSAAVPGLGQIYNKKYWKLPIIYVGLGAATAGIIYNRNNWQHYKQAYVRDTNIADGDWSIYRDQNYSTGDLQNASEQARTRMEYCYIAFGVVYLLQVVDAAVDAHLFYFDVSEDLSMHIMPTMHYTAHREPVHGLSLTLRF